MQIYLLIFSLHLLTKGTHGEWCNANNGNRFCETGCCGTYWNRTCCPTRGKLCNINGEILYCPTGCCGINDFNRTCCPVTEKPIIRNTTTWRPTTRYPTWRPTTRYPTWRPTTRYPTWHPDTDRPNSGVWCTHRGGRIYCRYGCCGTYDARSCCSATGSPDVTGNPPAVTVSTTIVAIVSSLAAIIGVTAILVGVYCCLRTGQGSRGQTVCPVVATVSPNIQAGVHSTAPPIYAAPVSAGPPSGHAAFSNLTYRETPINSDTVIHSQQNTVAHN